MEDNQNIIETVTDVVDTKDSNKSKAWNKESWQRLGVGIGILLGVEYVIVPATKAAWKTAKAWNENRKIKKKQTQEKDE